MLGGIGKAGTAALSACTRESAPRRMLLLATGLLAVAGVLFGCSGDTPAPPEAAARSTPGGDAAGPDFGLPITHIHGVVRDPATGGVVIATHEGAFERRDGDWYSMGDVIDLMGFTIAPDGTWFASGHPGIDSDLPQPVGLISSADRGQTWWVRSRGGQSDFHALSSGPSGILGFDGTLRTSPDGTTWADVPIPAAPFALSVEPASGDVLATTEQGLFTSTDDGATWTALEPPALVALIDWADENTAVGLTVDGNLVISEDSGQSWTTGPSLPSQAQAMSAHRLPSGEVEILVASDEGVLTSVDDGATLTPLP